ALPAGHGLLRGRRRRRRASRGAAGPGGGPALRAGAGALAEAPSGRGGQAVSPSAARRSRRLGLALLLALGVLPLAADSLPPQVHYENVPYNGRFTFLRLRFDPTYWRPGNYMWGLDLSWNHDYPRGETHLVKILGEVTNIEVNTASNILALDEPELFKYPIAYICEVGQWQMSEGEARGLHDYLLKGGFLIVDDFAGRDL